MPFLIPIPEAIQVDTRGAVILHEESPETRDSRGIYLPNHIEPVSHIAVDIGGSLAKVVYFTRSSDAPSTPPGTSGLTNGFHNHGNGNGYHDHFEPEGSTVKSNGTPNKQHRFNGALTPSSLESPPLPNFGYQFADELVRRAAMKNLPGGSLNFERFQTEDIEECVEFIQTLIAQSAEANGVSIEEMRKSVKIMATGGGAHKFYDLFTKQLEVEVHREDEMECLIKGLRFITLIRGETFWYSDELVQSVTRQTIELERPSPTPPQYQVSFEERPTPQLPCLLVNIGSGVSIVKVEADGKYERVSGTSLGGGTLWGLLSLLTPATTFDEMLALSEQGDNSAVDMLVGDIYGQDYGKLGLKSTTIASSFGKVFQKGVKRSFKPEDIARSLLYAISNNIGQIAYMNAEKYNLERIYFGGCFIRGHAATIATLSYAIRFWSKGSKRALFLRHEGFLGAIGAWIKNIEPPHAM
ncbi:fumble [Dacryopinax primogenitus]|uniref:Fumble n=1 Tax=Dacryopinax primogenitus (strain DJM 731) TaxID=1858805 RepID=M5FRV1_DACPD|nr:fumble [Dacryopinax primogenitus]EJT99965.1 fumble [Dacryopinax primogenitus]